MKVFLTGGTGFIGGHVASQLRGRGDDVVAMVRDRAKAADLAAAGCEIVEGDLGDTGAIAAGMQGCDAVIHGAAQYKVGIPKGERAAMHDANVRGTERVLDAALEQKIPRVLYISTIAVFGNTHGQVVDETYEGTHPNSYYDETKLEAHRVAKERIAAGLPCVIVQPGGVYGPGDHSQLGNTFDQFLAGRLPMIAFPELGLNLVYVEDAATGVVLGLDKGEAGESYVLGGQITTMREIIETLAKVSGRKAPKRAMPTALLKASAPLGPVLAPLLGYPPNLRELIATSDGVTYWARHDKAMEKLGYSPRGLEQGLRDMLAAEGKLPAAA